MTSLNWPSEGSGNTNGPVSSTDNAVARFDGTSGTLLQNSVVTIDDSGNITTAGTVDGRDVSVDGAKLDASTAANTVSTLVLRDGSGNFSAGTITATLTGNVTGNLTGDVTGNLTGDVTGDVTGNLTGNVTGDLTGNVTGNVSGTAANVTGVVAIANGGTNSSTALTDDKVMVSTAGAIVESAVTTTTLGYLDATSSIQTQLDGKEPTITTLSIAKGGTNSGTALNSNRFIVSSAGAIVEASAVTASRALVSDANGLPTHSATTATEIGYVNGVTSAIQTQLDAINAGKGIVSVSSDVTLTDQRIHLVDTSAARSLTLPSPSATSFIVVKDSTGSAQTNNITIVRSGTEQIETVAASYTLDTNLGSWTFVSDATNWFII